MQVTEKDNSGNQPAGSALSAGLGEETGALYLLARVREALGDNGKRMQDELIEYCRALRNERDSYRAALEQIGADGAKISQGWAAEYHMIARKALRNIA